MGQNESMPLLFWGSLSIIPSIFLHFSTFREVCSQLQFTITAESRRRAEFSVAGKTGYMYITKFYSIFPVLFCIVTVIPKLLLVHVTFSCSYTSKQQLYLTYILEIAL